MERRGRGRGKGKGQAEQNPPEAKGRVAPPRPPPILCAGLWSRQVSWAAAEALVALLSDHVTQNRRGGL